MVDDVVALGVNAGLSDGFGVVLGDENSVGENCVVVGSTVYSESGAGGEFANRYPARRVVYIVNGSDCLKRKCVLGGCSIVELGAVGLDEGFSCGGDEFALDVNTFDNGDEAGLVTLGFGEFVAGGVGNRGEK